MTFPKSLTTYLLILLAISGCGKLTSSKEQSSGPKNGTVPPVYPEKVTVTGSLSLGSEVEAVNGLAKSQSLEGAVVFIRGEPDTFAKTDATGAFSLDIAISPAVLSESTTQLNQDGDPEYSMAEAVVPKRDVALVMWYTTPEREGEKKARFGTKKDANLTATNPVVVLGSLGLNYTRTLQITVKSSTNMTPLLDCTAEVEGFGSRIKSSHEGAGVYKVDYLPADSYNVAVTCGGHDSKTLAVTVDPAAGPWEVQTTDVVVLTPSVMPATP